MKPIFPHPQHTLQTKNLNFYIKTLILPTKREQNHTQNTKIRIADSPPYSKLLRKPTQAFSVGQAAVNPNHKGGPVRSFVSLIFRVVSAHLRSVRSPLHSDFRPTSYTPIHGTKQRHRQWPKDRYSPKYCLPDTLCTEARILFVATVRNITISFVATVRRTRRNQQKNQRTIIKGTKASGAKTSGTYPPRTPPNGTHFDFNIVYTIQAALRRCASYGRTLPREAHRLRALGSSGVQGFRNSSDSNAD